jgi:hypothetical protein
LNVILRFFVFSLIELIEFIIYSSILNLKKLEEQIKSGVLKNNSTQTGDSSEFMLYFGQNKNARIYFSSANKEIVLSFNFCSKSFIFTLISMWLLFRRHVTEIDSLLLKND